MFSKNWDLVIMRFSTPLRYPGGKGKLTGFIKKTIKDNDLEGCSYVEPYAGGAGVALSLLYDGYVSSIHLNDLNRSIYAFWHSALYENDALCDLIERTSITMDEWNLQRAVQDDAEGKSLLELGFSTFFLNRTNRSGIIKGGVIGGKGQLGKWTLDVRFNKTDLIKRLHKIKEHNERIFIYNYDAAFLLKNVIPKIKSKTLVYLDPPYYVKGQGLYQNFYQHDDHVEISNIIKEKLETSWIVSYDAAPEIIEMYEKENKIIYGLHYSAQKKHVGSEVMFFSEDLLVPAVENPSKIKQHRVKNKTPQMVNGLE